MTNPTSPISPSNLTPLGALNVIFADVVPRIYLTSATTVNALAAAGRTMTRQAKAIDWDVQTAGITGVSVPTGYAPSAVGASNVEGIVVNANLGIGGFRISYPFQVSTVDIANAIARSPLELQDLFQRKIQDGIIGILRTANNYIWNGDGSVTYAGVTGLTQVLNPTATYAGISPSTYPNWIPVVYDISTPGSPPTTNALTRANMTHFDRLVMEYETGYNMVISHPGTVEQYTNLFDSTGLAAALPIDYNQDAFRTVDMGHSPKKFFNGYPIVQDVFAPLGSIITMNLNDVTLWSFKAEVPASSTNPYREVVSNNAAGITINMTELPSSVADLRQFEMFAYIQLQVYNRKSTQCIQGITTSALSPAAV